MGSAIHEVEEPGRPDATGILVRALDARSGAELWAVEPWALNDCDDRTIKATPQGVFVAFDGMDLDLDGSIGWDLVMLGTSGPLPSGSLPTSPARWELRGASFARRHRLPRLCLLTP